MRCHLKLDRIIPPLIVQNLHEIIINLLITKLEEHLRLHHNLETIVFNRHRKHQDRNLVSNQHQEVHLQVVEVVVVVPEVEAEEVQHHVLAADKFNF